MKFKKIVGGTYKNITIVDKDGDELIVETREDGAPGLFFDAPGVYVSKKKAIKLAHAIIAELDPENMWVMS